MVRTFDINHGWPWFVSNVATIGRNATNCQTFPVLSIYDIGEFQLSHIVRLVANNFGFEFIMNNSALQ